jgi:Reverse transcriptase (RNA-dependent DNA polymerase)
MDDEMYVIVKNDTFELTSLPEGHKAIGVKWVYKKKVSPQDEIVKYKQQAGIDYEEVFAPAVRIETIRLLISLVAQSK